MAPKYQKEPVQVFTRWRIRQKEPVHVYTVTDPFGTETVPKLDLLLGRSRFRTWGPFLESSGNLPGPINMSFRHLHLLWYLVNVFIEL